LDVVDKYCGHIRGRRYAEIAYIADNAQSLGTVITRLACPAVLALAANTPYSTLPS
jgi:hypothetical protein